MRTRYSGRGCVALLSRIADRVYHLNLTGESELFLEYVCREADYEGATLNCNMPLTGFVWNGQCYQRMPHAVDPD